MSSFAALLKSEITRIARKECKSFVDPFRKANATQRRQIAELKHELAEVRKFARQASRPDGVRSNTKTDQAANARFSAAGLKALRAKTGLSANDFGKLVGASDLWESERAVPRAGMRVEIAALRLVGKREALRRLAAMG